MEIRLQPTSEIAKARIASGDDKYPLDQLAVGQSVVIEYSPAAYRTLTNNVAYKNKDLEGAQYQIFIIDNTIEIARIS